MVQESPPAMVRILGALAGSQVSGLSISDLATAISPKGGLEDRRGNSGCLRSPSDQPLRLAEIPVWESVRPRAAWAVCRMSEEMARVIKRLIAERG